MKPGSTNRARGWLKAYALLLAIAPIGLAQDGWTGTRRGLAGKDLNAVYFADTKRGWIAGDNGFVSYTK